MTIAKLYKQTCEYYQKKPDPSACEKWETALQGFGVSEIEAALRHHEADSRIDDFGRTRGSYMPFASDLAALIHDNRRRSVLGNKFEPCGKCVEGWIYTKKTNSVGVEGAAVIPCQCRREWIEANRKSA